MKLWGVAMVRNEADIIEAFVRHNLTILDGLLVVDHGSGDATPGILAALLAERVPLVVMRSDTVGYLQAEIVTTAVRDAFARGRADAVFPLDADEFLRIGPRAELEAALAALPAGHYGRVAWPTFVPPLDTDPADTLAPLRTARRCDTLLPPAQRALSKVVLTGHFALDASATLMMGNHDVILGRDTRRSPPMPHVDLPPRLAEVCHVPVRSRRQFVTKIAVKHLARLAAGRHYLPHSPMHVALDAIRHGTPLTRHQMLSAHRMLDREAFEAALALPDTGEDRFLADIALRYTTPLPEDAMPVVLNAVERLVRRVVEARTAATARSPAAGSRAPA